jgi:hypothetical protein
MHHIEHDTGGYIHESTTVYGRHGHGPADNVYAKHQYYQSELYESDKRVDIYVERRGNNGQCEPAERNGEPSGNIYGTDNEYADGMQQRGVNGTGERE